MNYFLLDRQYLHISTIQIGKGATGQHLNPKLIKIWLKIDKYIFQATREIRQKYALIMHLINNKIVLYEARVYFRFKILKNK